LRASPWVTGVDASADGGLRITVSDPATASSSLLVVVVDAGVRVADFERVRPTLEDVFLELVGTPSADKLDGRGFVRPREVDR
jgi:ABC-type uncharacterized transport system ATPase subunit